MASSYWDYYRPDYTWNDGGSFPTDLQETEEAFAKAGFSDAQVRNLVSSGYVISRDLVIDRYYGGRLLSSDMRSRIKLSHFVEEPLFKEHPAHVCHAGSIEEVMECIGRWRSISSRRLLFRGQTCSYELSRARPNPAYTIQGLGELSLIPSLWRKMVGLGHIGPEQFTNLSLFEWSKILYSGLDMGQIERRHQEALERGECMYTAQDMEDSDDPVLKAFGKQRLDVMMGLEYDLAAECGTLLQHYGLLSPLLDLSSDVDVALYFATHKFMKDANTGHCMYEYVGTNDRRAVLYAA